MSELKFPPETIIIVVVRGNHAYIPNGSFRIESGDELVLMGSEDNIQTAEKLLYDNVR